MLLFGDIVPDAESTPSARAVRKQKLQENSYQRNPFDFPNAIEQAHRFDLSLNKTAILINAIIDDFTKILEKNGVDVPNHKQFHISPNKVRNMKERLGLALTNEHLETTHDLVCLGIDGKKGPCLTKNSGYEKLEKVSVNSHPGSHYVDYFIPDSGRGTDLAKETISIIDLYRSRESLRAMLCDNAAPNTGVHNGKK